MKYKIFVKYQIDQAFELLCTCVKYDLQTEDHSVVLYWATEKDLASNILHEHSNLCVLPNTCPVLVKRVYDEE